MAGPLALAFAALLASAPRGEARHPQPAANCNALGGKSLAHELLAATPVEAAPEPRNLPDLELAVTPEKKEVAAGGAVLLLATLRNRGIKPLELVFELGAGADALVHGFPTRVRPLKAMSSPYGAVPAGPVQRRVQLRLAPGAVLCASGRAIMSDAAGNKLGPGAYTVELATGLASTLASPQTPISVPP